MENFYDFKLKCNFHKVKRFGIQNIYVKIHVDIYMRGQHIFYDSIEVNPHKYEIIDFHFNCKHIFLNEETKKCINQKATELFRKYAIIFGY